MGNLAILLWIGGTGLIKVHSLHSRNPTIIRRRCQQWWPHPIRPSPRASMQISVPQIFLTPNASNLMNKMNYIGNEQIHVEDGTGLSIHVIGSSSFPSQFNSKILSLNQLLHVPYCF